MQEKNLTASRFFTNTKNNIHFFSEKVNIGLTLILSIWYNCIVLMIRKDGKSQTTGLGFF